MKWKVIIRNIAVIADHRMIKWDFTTTRSTTITCCTKTRPRASTTLDILQRPLPPITTTTRCPVTITSPPRLPPSSARPTATAAPRISPTAASSRRSVKLNHRKSRTLTRFRWKSFTRSSQTLPITCRSWIKCARQKTRRSLKKVWRVSLKVGETFSVFALFIEIIYLLHDSDTTQRQHEFVLQISLSLKYFKPPEIFLQPNYLQDL